MQELTEIINNNQRDTPFRLIRWLQTHHVEIMQEKKFKVVDFIRDIFTLILQRPNNYKAEEWERLTMILYTFIISTIPPSNIIPRISLKKEYGPLLSISLLLNSFRSPDIELKQQYIEIFHFAVDYFNKGFETSHFYSRSPIYFYHSIPTLLDNEILSKEFEPELYFFLTSIPHINEKDLNYDFVLFTSDVLKRLLKRNHPIFPDELIAAFKRIFELGSNSSYIFLQHFFYSWFYFVKTYCDSYKEGKELFSDQIDTVTKLFQTTASLKHHELHRTFNWHLCFYFFNFVGNEEYQERILALICNGIRRAVRFDTFPRILEAARTFSTRWKDKYRQMNSWPLHYMVATLDSSVYSLILNMNRIVGAASMNSTQNELISMNKVFFSDENNGLSPLDSELYALYPERLFKKLDEVVPVFDLMMKYCDSIRNHLSSVALFHLSFAKGFCELLREELENGTDEEMSVPLHYLIETIRSWTRLMINVAHKQNLMNTYSQREIVSFPKIPSNLSSKIKNPKRFLDFAPIFKRFFNTIKECPHEFYHLIATTIAYEMFRAMKKHILTYTFIEYFHFLPLDLENYQNSLFSHLFSKMLEIAANNTELFFSSSITETDLLYHWILFTIRFGASLTNDQPNPLLGLFLKSYHKLFVAAVLFNIKRIINQSVALKTVTVFLQQIKYHYHQTEFDIEDEKKKKARGRSPIVIDDIQESAKIEAFDTILTLFNEQPHYIENKHLIPFLEETFKLGDQRLISKAVDICVSKFDAEKAEKYIHSPNANLSFFNSLFSVINKVDHDLGKKILKIIPAYSPLYLKNDHKPTNFRKEIVIEEYGFNLDSILEEIINHLDGNDETFAALFTFIVCCFQIVFKCVNLPPSTYTSTMTKLIFLLCHCWTHDHLHAQIESFSYHLTHQFGDAFIRCDSNVFILCLFDVAGRSHSAMTEIALDIAKTFFEYISTKKIPEYFLYQTINSLLSWFPLTSRLFSIVCSFSLFNRYFPNIITIDHVRAFLIQTTDVYPLDMKFSKIVNRFLKEFLSNKSDDEKKVFVKMVYDIICPLSIGIRNVLMKRVGKLGFPMPVQSLSEIEESSTPLLFIERATLVFLCGMEGPFEMTPSFYNKILEFISQKVDQSNSFEKLSRTLSLTISVLKNDEVLAYFTERHQLFILLQFVCQALTARIAPLSKRAKKCFRILKHIQIHDSRFEEQLNEFYKNSDLLYKFFSLQPERINFYVRLTKLEPTKIPPQSIKIFLNGILEYSSKSFSDKMLNIQHFCKILKMFTVRDYITIPEVTSIIFSNYDQNYTYFQMYIKTICKLYELNEIPFNALSRKYINRFLIMFPDETISYLMYNERSPFFYFLLFDLIYNDNEMIFFRSFLNQFGSFNDYSNINPSIFKVAELLSEYDKFISIPEFLHALKHNFNNLYTIVSDSKIHNENDFTLISYCSMSIINIFKCIIDVEDVISFIRIFRFSFFCRSHISKKFIITVFKNASQDTLMKLLDYVVNNATKLESIYIQKLLPHLIKNITEIDLSFLWDKLPKWASAPNDSQFAFLHSILRLLEKCPPPREALPIIFDIFKTTLSSSDIRLLIYSLKIATSLSKMKLLPPVVYFSIFRQLFTYPKFSEPPYSNYFFKFLKSDPERLTQLSAEDADLMSYYMHNRLLHPREFQNVLSPINSVFIAAPQLISYLPFSIITAISTLLENKLNNSDKTKEPGEIGDAFKYAANFCLIMKPTQEELNYFIRVGFHYLNILIHDQNSNNPEFIEYFYNILTSNTTDYFPEEMLDEITSIDYIYFGLVCCASNIIPEVLFNKFPELVEDSLKYVENESSIVNNQCFQCFINNLCSDPLIEEKFRRPIYNVFNYIKSWYSAKNCDQLFIISKAMIACNPSETLDDLWNFYDSLHGKKVDKLPLLRFLIRSIENVPLDNQIVTVQMIFSRVKKSAQKTHVFTTSLPFIFQSNTVNNSAKFYIVENLIPLLLIDKLCNAEKMLAMLIEYNQETDCTRYIIQLLLIRAHRAHGSGCLVFIEKIIEMLPVDFKARILYLMTILPIELWEDSFLPVIISLLIPKTEIWQPLFTLAYKLSSIGSELVAVTFSKLLDESNVFDFERFLSKLLDCHLKIKHMQIISGVLTMFHMKKVKIAYNLTEKAMKYSGNFYQLEFFLEPETNSIPVMRYLFPHDANDIIYGIYRPYLTSNQAAAVALTFINEYEAAYSTYVKLDDGLSDSSPFFKEMRKVNNHFIINDESLHSLLIPLTTIGHENSAIDWIERAAESYSTSTNIEALEKATDANLSTTIGKQFFSPFEKQRLCVIQSIVSFLEGKPQLNYDSSCFSQVFIELYTKLQKNLNKDIKSADFNENVINSKESPVVFLIPSMKNVFREVCGFTPHGFVAISYSQINEYLSRITKKIESSEMIQKDWHQFAIFVFSLYSIQPTSELSTAAFGAYSKVFLDDNLGFPVYVVHEAACRIITMIRLAINNNDEQLISLIKSASNLFLITHGQKWSFWLPQLVEFASIPWFCDMIFDIVRSMPYRSLLYAKKNKQCQLDLKLKVIHSMPLNQNAIMDIVENYFLSLFSINFEEKEMQNRLFDFLIEAQKLLKRFDGKDEIKIDLLEERKKNPQNLLQQYLKKLTMSQINLLGDFSELSKKLVNMTFDDLIEFIKNITNSSMSLKEIHVKIKQLAHNLNENLPFILPLRYEELFKISVNHLKDDFEVISPNVILCKMTSNVPNWQTYIVQRALDKEGYRKSVLTLSNALFLANLMLKNQYSAQRRNLRVFPGHVFEIGDSIIMYQMQQKPTTMEYLFEESEMMTTYEFLQKYAKLSSSHETSLNDSSNETSLNSNSRSLYELNDLGKERIQSFNTNYLLQKFINEIGQDNVMRMRAAWSDSLIVSSVVRVMVNGNYPSLSTCIIFDSMGLPITQLDYNFAACSTSEDISSVRLSPNVLSFCGPTMSGRFVLIVSIVSKTLLENIETIRSIIETMIGDGDYDYGRSRSLEELVQARYLIENRFLKFCPPTGRAITAECTNNWIQAIEELMAKATNPDIQPVEAIPWF